MEPNFEASVVCLRRAGLEGSKSAGTGFVAGDGRTILTCEHVIRAARTGNDPVHFSRFGQPGTIFTGTVDAASLSVAFDFASVQWTGDVPEDVVALPLATGAPSDQDAIKSVGFPIDPATPLRGQGTYIGLNPTGATHIYQLSSLEITRGFSGGPVWSTAAQAVIGVVNSVVTPDLERMANVTLATPLDIVFAQLPRLRPSLVNPYRGLDFFSEADRTRFFGRTDVVDRLEGTLANTRSILTVLGPSGSGKSSVVLAGLVPRLNERRTLDAEWRTRRVRPTDFTTTGVSLGALLAAETAGVPSDPQTRYALVIDQFEEAFTALTTEARAAFVADVLAIVEGRPRVAVIVVARDDFYDRIAREAPALVTDHRDAIVNVPSAVGKTGLAQIVREPARLAGLRFEDGLAEAILADAGAGALDGSTTMLPFVQLALTRLAQRAAARDGLMRASDYEALGRLQGALAGWASDTYRGLAPGLQPLAKRVLLALVRVDDRAPVANLRARRTLPELAGLFAPADRPGALEVIRVLADARVLTTSTTATQPAAAPAVPTVEIVHEALIAAWPDLRRWLAENRLFLAWQQDTQDRMAAWIATAPDAIDARDDGETLPARRVTEGETWLRERADVPPQLADYIERSRRSVDDAAARARRSRAFERLQAAKDLGDVSDPRGAVDQRTLLALASYQELPTREAYALVRDGLARHPPLIGRRRLDTIPDEAYACRDRVMLLTGDTIDVRSATTLETVATQMLATLLATVAPHATFSPGPFTPSTTGRYAVLTAATSRFLVDLDAGTVVGQATWRGGPRSVFDTADSLAVVANSDAIAVYDLAARTLRRSIPPAGPIGFDGIAALYVLDFAAGDAVCYDLAAGGERRIALAMPAGAAATLTGTYAFLAEVTQADKPVATDIVRLADGARVRATLSAQARERIRRPEALFEPPAFAPGSDRYAVRAIAPQPNAAPYDVAVAILEAQDRRPGIALRRQGDRSIVMTDPALDDVFEIPHVRGAATEDTVTLLCAMTDDRTICTVSANAKSAWIERWDVGRGRETRRLRGYGAFGEYAVDPSGMRVAFGYEDRVDVVDVATQSRCARFALDPPRPAVRKTRSEPDAIVFAGDGRTVYVRTSDDDERYAAFELSGATPLSVPRVAAVTAGIGATSLPTVALAGGAVITLSRDGTLQRSAANGEAARSLGSIYAHEPLPDNSGRLGPPLTPAQRSTDGLTLHASSDGLSVAVIGIRENSARDARSGVGYFSTIDGERVGEQWSTQIPRFFTPTDYRSAGVFVAFWLEDGVEIQALLFPDELAGRCAQVIARAAGDR